MNPKVKWLKKEREKSLNFPQEKWKYPDIHLEERARHFEHEYIIKLSKKDLVSYQLNLMLNLNQGIALFRQTQTLRPKKTQQGSQQDLSSVKWINPGHFPKAQGKFIFLFPYTLFLHIFDT